MLDAGRVIPKDQILDHVRQSDWGRDAYIVETYVSYPRRKVDNPVGPDDRAVTPLIHTGRGFRYMLRETPA
jgi:two-component system OmpR family response regulator